MIKEFSNELLNDDNFYIDFNNKNSFKNIHFLNLQVQGKTFLYNKNKIEFQVRKYIDFVDCEFDEIVFNMVIPIEYSFINCKFNKIEFNNIKITNDTKGNIKFVFPSISKEPIKYINEIKIQNSTFKEKFYINDQKYNKNEIIINKIDIKESTFQNNFKMHNSIVENTVISGVDFKENADFFKSKFNNDENILFKSININGLTIFEECEFYKKFIIEYATFKGLVQFRNAIFTNGFCIDKINTEKEMNFFGIKGLEKISNNNDTSQETYRIMKYNCERIGNIIDANMYHSLELEKRKEDLEQQKMSQEKAVFWFNWFTSKFGTDYIRPLYGILIVGFLTLFLINLSNIFAHISLNGQELFNTISSHTFVEYIKYIWNNIINKAFGYMYILNKDFFKGNELIFVVNKVFLGYLYYQFIIAVRKDTRK